VTNDIVAIHPEEGKTPRIFRVLTAAIVHADAEGDSRTVDLLLAAKTGAVRRHYALLAEGR